MQIYGKDGFLTITDKGRHVLIEISKRQREIKIDPRVTRTGFGLELIIILSTMIYHIHLKMIYPCMKKILYTISRETIAQRNFNCFNC